MSEILGPTGTAVSSVKEECVWFPGVLIVMLKFMIVVFFFIKHERK